MKGINKKTIEKIKTRQPVTFDELIPLLRPRGIQNGLMKIDYEKCKGCGLCIRNCPFKCWERGEGGIPRLKSKYTCFSCFNCMTACPFQAISIVKTYRVKGGYFDTEFPPIKMPKEPRDAKDNPTKWNEVERLILNRRSVRNFKDKPIPESLIHRLLEAGRFAPSAGNAQPIKFAVVTNKSFIAELEKIAHKIFSDLYQLYMSDETAIQLFSIFGSSLPAPVFDFRVIGSGFRAVARKDLPIFFNAPCVIFLGANQKLPDVEVQAGICGQNMSLVAQSLGLGCCWSNMGREVRSIPEIKAKLGYGNDWNIITTLCLGYPKFKQLGMVPRMFRPITWFRNESDEPQIEQYPQSPISKKGDE